MSEQLDLTDEATHTQSEYDQGDRNPTVDIFVVERPWGQFQQFVSNETVTVKIITVEPGHRLSLQKHEHRGEMWQILDVPIDITVGERRGWPSRARRSGCPGARPTGWATAAREPGRLLEVAFGHFDEADIERLEDDYAR